MAPWPASQVGSDDKRDRILFFSWQYHGFVANNNNDLSKIKKERIFGEALKHDWNEDTVPIFVNILKIDPNKRV